jgi:pimeloyl-ACP methyl ester carboxylesterase
VTHTHLTAPTKHVEANGIRFAYRRLGAETGTPLVFLQHFRGGMDHWDPAVTDRLAADRPVILFNNAGVASSTGETPNTVEAMARHAIDFIEVLGLGKVDLLGFSLGGCVAQSVVLQEPDLVRRLMLVGTSPRGGEPTQDSSVMQRAASTDPRTGDSPLETFMYLFFSPSERGQAAGRAFWERRHLRKDPDVSSPAKTIMAQGAAAKDWRELKGERHADLKRIGQPTLVVNGSSDVMIPTVNSFTLSQHIPNAQLILYPDSGHASQFQYPERFVTHARTFLAEA